MDFKELYSLVEQQKLDVPVGFQFICEQITGGQNDVQEVKVWRHVYDPPKRTAHFMLFDDRTSAYNEEYLVADISYCSSLESDAADLFFALCKELMHVFDPVEARIDTPEKFRQFLRDLQNSPLDLAKLGINMEHRAHWMAILLLCPKTLRDRICTEIAEGRALKSEVAQRVGLPEWLIEVVLDEYYNEALSILTE